MSESGNPGRRREPTVNVELTPEANKAADELADKFGMKKKVMVQRVLAWLRGQPDAVQHAALKQLVPGFEVETLRLVLEGMEAQRKSGRNPGDRGVARVSEMR